MALRAIFCYYGPATEKTFKSCDRKQMLLLPPSLLDWLPEADLAHFILNAVEQLDISKVYGSYLANGRDSHYPGMPDTVILHPVCFTGSVGRPPCPRGRNRGSNLAASRRHIEGPMSPATYSRSGCRITGQRPGCQSMNPPNTANSYCRNVS